MSFNPDRINIHELTIEEPEKESDLSFDPKNIWREQDFDALQKLASGKLLEKGEEYAGREYLFLNSNAALAVLDKDKLPEIDDKYKERIWKLITTTQAIDERSLCYLHLKDLAWATQISPEFLERSRVDRHINVTHIVSTNPTMKYESESILKNEPVLEQVVGLGEEQLEKCRSANDWRHAFEVASWLTVVGSRPKLNNQDFKNFEHELKNQSYAGYLIEDAAAMSIIYPDYPLQLSAKEGGEIKSFLTELNTSEGLRRAPREDWCMYTAMAKIAYDKCKEVSLKKGFGSETPPIPEIKKF